MTVSYTHLDVYKRQVYVDDILIASRTFSEHLEHLEYVLNKLQTGGLTINWEKSKFLQTEIHFLGFIITPEGILANPDKVEAIMRFPEPKNIKQLQSFLGPVSYTHLDVYKRQQLIRIFIYF